MAKISLETSPTLALNEPVKNGPEKALPVYIVPKKKNFEICRVLNQFQMQVFFHD